LIFGNSGSGKSSLINYLAGKALAKVGDSGKSETKKNMTYEVKLKNLNLRIFDTKGFNSTDGVPNGTVASRIKF
jgi:putative ribosome biogenesis GTPase RsgA